MYNSTHLHQPHGAETQNSCAYSNGGHHINESERNVSSIGNASERRPSNISVLSLVDKVHMARDEVFSGPMSESVPSSLTSYAHHARRADSIASFTFYRDDEPFLLLADGNVLDDSDSDIPVPRDDTIDLESGEIPPLGISSETPEHDFLLSRASGRTNISYQGCESRVRQKIHIISDDITIVVVGFQNSILGYIMYVALCCLSLGIGYLILHWMPSWKVSLIGKPCPLCECDWVVIEVSWSPSITLLRYRISRYISPVQQKLIYKHRTHGENFMSRKSHLRLMVILYQLCLAKVRNTKSNTLKMKTLLWINSVF